MDLTAIFLDELHKIGAAAVAVPIIKTVATKVLPALKDVAMGTAANAATSAVSSVGRQGPPAAVENPKPKGVRQGTITTTSAKL